MNERVHQHVRGLRQRLRRLIRPALPRIEPLSEDFGYDRGTPIDRYYIAQFIAQHGADVRGRVVEIKEPLYTRRFGTDVERSDVLDIDARNPLATIIADLADGSGIPSEAFDCFILTQTLHYIYRAEDAVRQAHRALRRSGVLLASVPTVSRIADLPGIAPDCWRFTAAACTRMFGEVFGSAHVTVRAHGNLRTAVGFLTGLAAEELPPADLERTDERFPLLVTVRAVRHD